VIIPQEDSSSRGFKDWDKYDHLCIDVDDVEDENLLVHFEESGAWIEKALNEGGGVLVHCAMGKSRSATIIIAYLLRKSYRQMQNSPTPKDLSTQTASLSIAPDNPRYSHPHTVTSALSLLRESRPIVEPNEGFMKQLELYAEMSCPTDIEGDTRYQRWVYGLEVEEAVACGKAPERVRFEDEVEGGGGAAEEEHQNVELRCRKCRKTLATSPYILHHTPKSTTSITSPYAPISSLSTPATSPPACQHHHLTPLSWMRPILSQGLLSGRIDCPNPKCGAQIGRYAWQGMQCSCGIWVCPAFTLAKGRVDEIIKNPVSNRQAGPSGGEGIGIRMPPGMRVKI